MPRYQSFDPNTELNGRTVLAFITSIKHSDIKTILEKHQLDQVDPNQWYSLQLVLNVLSDISDNANFQ